MKIQASRTIILLPQTISIIALLRQEKLPPTNSSQIPYLRSIPKMALTTKRNLNNKISSDPNKGISSVVTLTLFVVQQSIICYHRTNIWCLHGQSYKQILFSMITSVKQIISPAIFSLTYHWYQISNRWVGLDYSPFRCLSAAFCRWSIMPFLTTSISPVSR